MSTKGKDLLIALYSAGQVAKDVLDNPMVLLEKIAAEKDAAITITTEGPLNTDDLMYGFALQLLKWLNNSITDTLLSDIH